MRSHLEKRARRLDPEALALLRAPDFPPVFAHLFEWHGEFLLWAPTDRTPEWADWLGWATLMQHRPSPFELRMLRQIHDAYHATASSAAKARA